MKTRQNLILYIFLPLAILFGCLPQSISAQILAFDQNPPSLRWRQVQTARFQVIYPELFESKALELGSRLDSLMRVVNADLQGAIPARRTPVILQNQSVLSNGFVQLAPRRTEFVTTPPGQGENQDWLHQLAIHELRHIGQFDRLVGRMRAPLLEQLGLAMFGIHLPVWFYEGDAVRIESRLTPGGRGRTPSWIMPYRAQLLSGARYSYQKDFLGSYRDLTPGAYELGYLMVERMYREFGEGTAEALLGNVSRNLLRPYSFSKALKAISGVNTRQWHRETADSLEKAWRAEDLASGFRHYPHIIPLTDRSDLFPSDLLLPQWSGDQGRFYALRQGRSYIPEIIEMDTTGRVLRRVLQLGWQVAPHFSYGAGRITWDERRTDVRYAKQNFHVILIHDLATGRSRQLSKRSRLFSPALSRDGSRIAAVEIAADNRASIVLLDPDSGQRLDSFQAPEGWALQTPAFDPNGEFVVAVAVSKAGTAVVQLDLSQGQFQQLTHWDFQQIERPIYAGGILFKAHYGGKDQLYLLKDEIHQLTHARFGAFHPSPPATGDSLLLFNEYQHGGFRVAVLDIEHMEPLQVPSREPLLSAAAPGNRAPKTGNMGPATGNRDSSARSRNISKPYRGLGTAFNFHSLSVSAGDFSSLDMINPGIFLLSDNLLNTVQTRLGYLYDGNLRSSEYQAGITYQRYFPKFTVHYSNRPRTGVVDLPETSPSADRTVSDDPFALQWREHHTSLRMNIPFNWHRRQHIYYVNIAAGTSLTSRYRLRITPPHTPALNSQIKLVEDTFIRQIQFPAQAGLSIGHNIRSSSLDLAPRWGQHAALNYRYIKNNAANHGHASRQLSVRTVFYFPGIQRHHSASLRLSYQRGTGAYAALDDIPMVSGYAQLRPEKVHNTALATYRFPLAYPDWEIGNLAYITRLKGGIFADFQNINRRKPFEAKPRTVGIEILADLNLLRFYLPHFDLGGRLIYVPGSGQFLATYSFSYSY